MAGFTQFEASAPVVKPATEEVAYDKYWLKRMVINAGDPARPVEMRVIFAPARDMTAEVNVAGEMTTVSYKELMPNGPEKVLVIGDVFALAASNNTFAITMNTVFASLKAIATERNLL